MNRNGPREFEKAMRVHSRYNETLAGGIIWKRVIIAVAKCILLVASTVMLWFAFVEHDALYNPSTQNGFRVLVFIVIGFYLLHAMIHALTDRRYDE